MCRQAILQSFNIRVQSRGGRLSAVWPGRLREDVGCVGYSLRPACRLEGAGEVEVVIGGIVGSGDAVRFGAVLDCLKIRPGAVSTRGFPYPLWAHLKDADLREFGPARGAGPRHCEKTGLLSRSSICRAERGKPVAVGLTRSQNPPGAGRYPGL